MADISSPIIQDFAGMVADAVNEVEALLENPNLNEFQRNRFASMLGNLQRILSRTQDPEDSLSPEKLAAGFDSTAGEIRAFSAEIGFSSESFGSLNESALDIVLQQPATPPVGEIADQIIGNVDDPDLRQAQIQVASEVLLRGGSQQDFIERFLDEMEARGIEPPANFSDRPNAYAEMVSRSIYAETSRIATREAAKRAGIELGQISYHGALDPCSFAEAVVFRWDENGPSQYPTYSEVIQATGGHLFHPNCRHTTTNYIPEIKDEEDLELASSRTSAFRSYAAMPAEDRHRANLDALYTAREANQDSWDSVATEEGV